MPKQSDSRCDDNHLGHFFYNYMREIPNEICQIDAATGAEETCASVLSRSTRLAQRLGILGLRPGDPVALGGRNHLDAHIPFYAGLMSGLPVAGIDPHLKTCELKHLLKIVEPRLVFCDLEQLGQFQQALGELGQAPRVVAFGPGTSALDSFIAAQDLPPEREFQVATFNTAEVYCWLCSTSGSAGRPKVVALTHSLLRHKVDCFELNDQYVNDGSRKPALNVSTLHCISGCFNALLMPRHHVKVQTSAPTTPEHVIHIINKYKPAVTLCPPTALAPLIHHAVRCDFTCFDVIKLGGSKIHSELLANLRARARSDTRVIRGYGQTETGGVLLAFISEGNTHDVGILFQEYQGKLVDPDTGTTILKPDVSGELLVKGPTMACYYIDPAASEAAFDDEGYYKTGDLFYQDARGRYFFVDRHKMLIKYKNYQVVPADVEDVILSHGGVRDACVTGVPQARDGERAVACVVRRSGARVSAQEIKDHVAKHLSASKHLHGGVVFLDALPTTSSGKVHRHELKKLVLTAHRE